MRWPPAPDDRQTVSGTLGGRECGRGPSRSTGPGRRPWRGRPVTSPRACGGRSPRPRGARHRRTEIPRSLAPQTRRRVPRRRRGPAAGRSGTCITPRISLVAVCCSSDSVSSRLRACSSGNSRAFSIAITAWSANVCRSAIWRSVNGRTSGHRTRAIAPIAPRPAAAARRARCARARRGRTGGRPVGGRSQVGRCTTARRGSPGLSGCPASERGLIASAPPARRQGARSATRADQLALHADDEGAIGPVAEPRPRSHDVSRTGCRSVGSS